MTSYLRVRANIALGLIFTFGANTLGPMPLARAEDFRLPVPGVMVHLSPLFNPPILKGIKIHPDNPFRFDFILDKGDSQLSKNALKDESRKLIRYFLASLTIPEKDLWVNLSPYEKDRIIPKSFGLTEMGRDLLAEDYMLKQITASLIYPEDEVGKKFWKRIYEEAEKKFGTTNIPVNTFNKVWIVPEKAVVYENAKAGTAYVVESKLKVMLEQDYLSLQKHEGIQSDKAQVENANQLGSQIVREVVIPELTTEVNENKNFSHLRQVYNALILATWYKKRIKDSILYQAYADKNKVAGVNIDDPKEKEKIYQRYLQAFKKGVYNYIKEEQDPISQQVIPKKYFSGGVALTFGQANGATQLADSGIFELREGDIPYSAMINGDEAMLIESRVGVQTSHDQAMVGDREEMLNALRSAFPEERFLLLAMLFNITLPEFINQLVSIIEAPGEDYLPAKLKPVILNAVLQAAKDPTPENTNTLLALFKQFGSFKRDLMKLKEDQFGIDVMVAGFKQSIVSTIFILLTKSQRYEIFNDELQEVEKLPRSEFFPDAPYKEWANILLESEPNSFLNFIDGLIYKGFGREKSTYVLSRFMKILPPDLKRQAAEKIIERLNEGVVPERDDYDFDQLYYQSIESLPERVGVIHNLNVVRSIYENLKSNYVLTLKEGGNWQMFAAKFLTGSLSDQEIRSSDNEEEITVVVKINRYTQI